MAGRSGSASAWIAGGRDPGPFTAILTETDLSVSGLRVALGDEPPSVGTILLLRLSLERDNPGYRALGIVRRIEAGQATHPFVAIEFLELPESTLDALSTYTLHHL